MNETILNKLQKSSKITPSTEWDALYQERPVLIVSDVNNLQAALDKLEKVGGYGYIAIFRKDLFFFNTKLIFDGHNGEMLIASTIKIYK